MQRSQKIQCVHGNNRDAAEDYLLVSDNGWFSKHVITF